MVAEDYVSFETAKLLKEKGFNEDSWFHYDTDGDIVTRGYRLNRPDDIPAWTHQMVMKWLREVHKIDITVDPHEVGNNWIYQFHICQNKDYLFSRDIDTSYENCAETAIKYCLENLI